MKRMILAALLVLPLTAQADIIKCVNEAGQVAYQDSRCPPGAEETVLKIRGSRLGPVVTEPRELTDAQARVIESEARRLQTLRWRKADVDPEKANFMRNMTEFTLERIAHDPGSVQIVSWGEFETNGSSYRSEISYRARNLMGALRLARQMFYFDENGVIERTVDIE